MDSEYGSSSDMSLLANQITMNISILEDYNKRYGKSLLSVDSDERTPRMVLDARDDLMDAAFKLLQLAAGPSKITSIALSHFQTVSTLKWLFHFNIFNLVPEWESVSYDQLAESANVPVSELKRKLRMVITSCIFSESKNGTVRHNTFSRAFAHDEDLMRGIPFFCDVVMPASAKMVDATIRWPDSEEDHETARNIALGHDMTFAQFLTQHDRADGYTSLMRLLGSERRRQTICSADIVNGFDWQHLEKGSLVVDFGSCGIYTWELAELFPHLRFQVRGPQDKLNIMKGFVGLKNPGLMARIDFCSCDSHNDQISRGAAVYLLPEILQHMRDDEVAGLLQDVEGAMVPGSNLIIVDPILPNMGKGSLVIERERRCRDMIMRQLRNSGHRSLEELRQFATEGSVEFVEATCLPGSVVTTVVFGYCN